MNKPRYQGADSFGPGQEQDEPTLSANERKAKPRARLVQHRSRLKEQRRRQKLLAAIDQRLRAQAIREEEIAGANPAQRSSQPTRAADCEGVKGKGALVSADEHFEDSASSITPRIRAAIDAGKISWNGGRLEPIDPPIKHMTGKSLSEIINEDRGR